MRTRLFPVAAAFAAVAVAAGSASAAVIQSGLYRLHNHPDGNSVPPPYGAKFTELFAATGGTDVFTLDFDHLSSAAYLTVNAAGTQVHIFGQSYGGRDIGTVYANDQYKGVYTFDFVYNIGVGPVPGDDDMWVSGVNHANFGSITGPNGVGSVNLTDEGMGGYTFRFGDEDNDLGHRGFNGISGWGWMSYIRNNGSVDHISDTDWLFTATYEVPAPGASTLMGLGALALLRRRR